MDSIAILAVDANATCGIGVTDGVVTAALEGLAEGDTVATVGVNNIRDNGYVKIVTQ